MIASNLIETMEEIETEYDVNSIKYDGLYLWPYIRTSVFIAYSRKNEPLYKTKIRNLDKVKRLLKAIFKSDIRLFNRKNAVIIFDDGDDICVLDGKRRTKLFEAIRSVYADRCVPIVIPEDSVKYSAYEYKIDMDLISFFLKLERRKVRFDENKLSGEDVLLKIIEKLGISSLDTVDFIEKIVSGKQYYLKYFKRIKPEKIFVSAYYDYARMPAIAAAKELGIATIELQHGYIGYDNAAYRAYIETSKEPYADYFFSFGRKFSEVISSYIIEPNSIFEVGNGYLEKISEKEKENRTLLRQKYFQIENRKIICVIGNALEDLDLHEILMTINLLNSSDEYAVVFKPRNGRVYDVSHEYLFVEDEYDVYQCMQSSDITLTNISTCAFESLYLGTPVVFDNIGNLAKIRFEPFMSGMKGIAYVDDGQDIGKAVNAVIYFDREEIKIDGKKFYEDENNKRVKQAIIEIDLRHRKE